MLALEKWSHPHSSRHPARTPIAGEASQEMILAFCTVLFFPYNPAFFVL
jgi:hypothetical protein